MDPFSIVVGTVGLIQACAGVVNYLKDLKDVSDQLEEHLGVKLDEIIEVHRVASTISGLLHDVEKAYTASHDTKSLRSLFESIQVQLEGCKAIMDKVSHELKEIFDKSERLLDFIRHLKMSMKALSKESRFKQLRADLSVHQQQLALLVNSLTLYVLIGFSSAYIR